MDEAGPKRQAENLEFIQKLMQTKVHVLISVRKYIWEKFTTQFIELHQSVWISGLRQNNYDPKFSIQLEKFSDVQLRNAVNLLGLPSIDTWPPELTELASRPYWLRIIKNFFKEKNYLPSPRSRELVAKYLDRMKLHTLDNANSIRNLVPLEKLVYLCVAQLDSEDYFQYDLGKVLEQPNSLGLEELDALTPLGFLEIDYNESRLTFREELVFLYLFVRHFLRNPWKLLKPTPQMDFQKLLPPRRMALLSLLGQTKPGDLRDQLSNETTYIMFYLAGEIPAKSSEFASFMPFDAWAKELRQDWQQYDRYRGLPSLWLRGGHEVIVDDALVLEALPESMISSLEVNADHQITGLTIHASASDLPLFFEQAAKLPRLEKIDLSYNWIKSLAKNIGDLKMLEELNLRSNHLRVLPGEFKRIYQDLLF